MPTMLVVRLERGAGRSMKKCYDLQEPVNASEEPVRKGGWPCDNKRVSPLFGYLTNTFAKVCCTNMNDGKVRGKIHLIEETKTFGSKGFRKRLVVLEQDKGSFVNFVPIDFTRDDCDSVDELSEGQEVEIAFRLSGRRWQKDSDSEVRFFLNAEAVSFTVVGEGTPPRSSSSSTGNANDAFDEAGDDEAPF